MKKVWSKIESDPDILAGEPVFAGTRVPVALVGKMAQADSVESLVRAYPTIFKDDILVAKELFFQSDLQPRHPWHNQNTYVLRTDDMDKLVSFFSDLGLTFKTEKHGSGPEHYACEKNGKVLEIYPR